MPPHSGITSRFCSRDRQARRWGLPHLRRIFCAAAIGADYAPLSPCVRRYGYGAPQRCASVPRRSGTGGTSSRSSPAPALTIYDIPHRIYERAFGGRLQRGSVNSRKASRGIRRSPPSPRRYWVTTRCRPTPGFAVLFLWTAAALTLGPRDARPRADRSWRRLPGRGDLAAAVEAWQQALQILIRWPPPATMRGRDGKVTGGWC
jgi:hypothetical protein